MGRTCIIAHSQWHGLILQKLPYLYDSSRRGHDVVKSIYFFVYEMVSFLANHINCFLEFHKVWFCEAFLIYLVLLLQVTLNLFGTSIV